MDQLQSIDDKLTTHIEGELVRDTQMADKINHLSAKIEELEQSINSLLNLWEQARGMLTLVKWCAAIAGFGISIITFFKSR